MNALTTLTPMKAVEQVEAAGLEDARRIVADFAAAGLVKSYALMIETIDARGVSACVRGATVPAELWQRVVLGDIADDVWSAGTVRLAGSELVGGEPAAIVTGITFSRKHIDWLIAHHDGVPLSRRRKRKSKAAPPMAATVPISEADDEAADTPSVRRKANPGAIPVGALFASMEQTMVALNKSRGTIYNLIKRGDLVRKDDTGHRS